MDHHLHSNHSPISFIFERARDMNGKGKEKAVLLVDLTCDSDHEIHAAQREGGYHRRDSGYAGDEIGSWRLRNGKRRLNDAGNDFAFEYPTTSTSQQPSRKRHKFSDVYKRFATTEEPQEFRSKNHSNGYSPGSHETWDEHVPNPNIAWPTASDERLASFQEKCDAFEKRYRITNFDARYDHRLRSPTPPSPIAPGTPATPKIPMTPGCRFPPSPLVSPSPPYPELYPTIERSDSPENPTYSTMEHSASAGNADDSQNWQMKFKGRARKVGRSKSV